MKKRVKSLLLVVCLLVATMAVAVAGASGKKVDSNGTLVLYRNPVLDFAAEDMKAGLEDGDDYLDLEWKQQETLIKFLKEQFYVRDSVIETWKQQIYDHVGVQGKDVYYHVETIFDDYVSITDKTLIPGLDDVPELDIVPEETKKELFSLNAGNWFGWDAVKGGSVGSSTETDVVIKKADGTFTEPFSVVVKGNAQVGFEATMGDMYVEKYTLPLTLDGDSVEDVFAAKKGQSIESYITALEDKINQRADEYYAATNGNVKYTFLGWDINGDDVFDADKDIKEGQIYTKYKDAFGKEVNAAAAGDVDVTFKAIYKVEIKNFNVTWEDSKRGLTHTTNDIPYNTAITNPLNAENSDNYVVGNVYEIDGSNYEFLGWTLPDGTLNADYLNQYGVKNNDIKVSAQYMKIIPPSAPQYTVKYVIKLDGVEINELSKSIQVEEGDKAINLTIPGLSQYTGLEISAWQLNGADYDFETPVTGPLTLVLNAKRQFTVSFDLNGGEGDARDQKGFAGDSIVAPEEPTREGHTFEGWVDLNGNPVDFDAYKITKSETLKAVWNAYPEYTPVLSVSDKAVAGLEYTYGKFEWADVLADINAKVLVEGTEVDLTAKDCPFEVKVTGYELGGLVDTNLTVKVKITNNPEDTHVVYNEVASVKVPFKVVKGEAVVSIASQIVKYSKQPIAVTDIFVSNCETIDVIAGADVHDETFLKGGALVAMPDLFYQIFKGVIEEQNKKVDNLSLRDLQEVLAAIKGDNDIIDSMLAPYFEKEAAIDKLITTLERIQGILPTNSEIKIKIVNKEVKDSFAIPTNVGAYVLASIVVDSYVDSITETGYLVITPDGTRAELKWNRNDSNKVITVENAKTFDFGATATLDGKNSPDVQSHVGYLYVGVDKNADPLFRLKRDANDVDLTIGVYGQVAFVADWGNEMYYAEPIARPVIISPKAADVQILDKNGNENHIQLHTYNGKPVELKVTVNGIVPTSGLKVKYIGMDTTVDGWYRSEAPTDAGVYAVVALYTEYEDGELTTAGGNLGVLVIKPADTETVLDDDRYCPNTGEHFAKLANGKFDYLTLAIDKANNIYYVNVPEDFGPQLKALIEKLPYELETYVLDKIGQYLDFEGDVKISTITKALQDVAAKIDSVDKVQFVDEKTDVILDKLINKIRSSEKLDELLIKFESKLKDAIEKVGNKVDNKLGEDISEKLYAYVDSVLDVDGSGVDVDTAKIKDDLYEYLAKLGKKLPSDKYAELKGIVDEIVNLVETEVRPEEIEDLISQLIVYLNDFNSEDAKELIEKAYNYTFDRVDETVVYKYLDGIVETAAGYADKYSMGDHVRQIYAYAKQIYERDYSAVPKLEEYIDGLLVSLTDKLAENAPTGTIVFGRNPKDEGTYACYAINVSANYMPSLDDATLTIGCEIDENVWEKSYDYKGDRKATCTEKEIYHMVWRCIHCKEIAKVSARGYYGDYAPHQWAEVVADKYLKSAATCTEKAVYYKSCSVCGEKGTETFTVEGLAAHKEGDFVLEKCACPENEGQDKVWYCTECGVELRREHVKKDTPVIPEDPKDPEDPKPEDPKDPKDPEDPKPEDPKDPVKPDSPVTADNNNMFVWFAAMLVSVAGVVLAFFKKRSYR